MNLKISIPPNTRSTIVLQFSNLKDVLENDKKVETADGISSAMQQGENALIEVGSGDYLFTYNLTKS